jgi:hypothetical protein
MTQISDAFTVNDLMEAFRSLAASFPLFLVWFVGIFLALTRWRRHPRISLIVLVAIGGFFLSALITPFLYRVLVNVWQPGSAGDIELLFTIVRLCVSLFHAILWGLLLTAIFAWRREGQYLR